MEPLVWVRLVWFSWIGRFGLAGFDWYVEFGRLGLEGSVWFVRFGLVWFGSFSMV